MRRLIMVVVIMAGLLPALTAAAYDQSYNQNEWELIDSSDGIDTYRKSLPGTEVCEFMAVGFVDAGLETIGAVLSDIPAYPRWMPNFKEAGILEELDRYNKISYNVVSAPWPYRDRDVIVINETQQAFEQGMAVISFKAIDEHPLAPSTNRCFRITDLRGKYVLEYFGRDRSRVTYLHRIDPGGNIPLSLANRFGIRNDPYRIIMGLREMVQDRHYIEKGRASPEYDLIDAHGRDPERVKIVLENRVGEIMIDSVLLEKLFRMNHTVAYVHERKTTHDSIRTAIMDMFYSMVTPDPALEQYLQDRALEDIICLTGLLGERWLVRPLAQDKAMIEKFLENGNGLFEKLLSSRKAVSLFVDDPEIATRITTDPAVRQQILADETLKTELLDNIERFKQFKNAGEIIKARIAHYQ